MTKPSEALLCKLASIVVHADELMGPGGTTFDHHALGSLLTDEDVRGWIVSMAAFAPRPRGETYSSHLLS